MSEEIFDTLEGIGIVPVVEIDDAAGAVRLADALQQGGLNTMEVTFRTDDAEQAVRAIASEFPEFLLGAGTLLTADQVTAARDAGARFGVSPGFTPAVASASRAAGLPFVPGATTASEVMRNLDSGFDRVKFFPAERSGGAAMIAQLSAPLRRAGATFMPTGGVNLDNLRDYLAVDTVFAVGGTWIAPRAAIAEGDWPSITSRASAALAAVRSIREG